MLHDAISAVTLLEEACGTAAIYIASIAVVAFFAGIAHAISAERASANSGGLNAAREATAITRDTIAIITLLTCGQNAVAATCSRTCFKLTERIATIAIVLIIIITLFALVEDAVSADTLYESLFYSAHRTAAVARCLIAIITFLRRYDECIAANRSECFQ
jgi:hypothetical protein